MTRATGLDTLRTDAALRRVGGDTYYTRGEVYFARGAVKNLRVEPGRVTASVDGTHRYAVVIRADGRQLDWSCSCPLGEEGEACKHVVATGLAYLARPAREQNPSTESESSVEQYLRAADKSAFVTLLLQRMGDDPDLEAWLLLKAQRQGFRDDRAVMRAIDQALDLAGDPGYDDTASFVAQTEHAVELLESMLDASDYRAAAEFCEYALRRSFGAYEHIDDSDGGFGDVLRRMAAVHVKACAKGAVPGEQLAARLFSLALDDQWGVVSAADYRRALGKDGHARFAQIVRAEWDKLRALGPGSRDTGTSGRRYLLTGLMRDIAADSGDVDQMVEVEKRDRSHPAAFLRIAEILTRAKRHDEALEWAERGLAAFPGERFGGLRDFVVAAYLRGKRYAPALALRWAQFEGTAGVGTYDLLKKCASTAREWPAWRERALAHLRALAAKRANREGDWGGGPSSALVGIHLNEGDLAAALAQARAGGCSASLWQRLAEACEAERPEDAVAIYRGRLDAVIGAMSNQAYDQAAGMLRKIGGLMRRQGEAGAFLNLLGTVMIQHKAKRNLMKRLEPVAAEARRAGPGGKGSRG